MKPITFSPTFIKKLSELKRKDHRLFEKIQNRIKTFQVNPYHPSLRHHKLKGNLKDTWSISVNPSFRLLYIDDGSYYFFELGFHDEVYQK